MSRVWLAVAVLTLMVAAPASAKVPKFSSATITPGSGVGGVTVGMTKAKAVRVWGTPDRCQPARVGTTWCQYLGVSILPGGSRINQAFAGLYVRAGRIVGIEVEFAENPAIDPKVRKLKTSKGIRLGSTIASLRPAYGIKADGLGEAGLSRATLRRGSKCTVFYAPELPYQKIQGIYVGGCADRAF